MENEKLEGMINFEFSDGIVPFRTLRHLSNASKDADRISRFCRYMDVALVEGTKLGLYTTVIASYLN